MPKPQERFRWIKAPGEVWAVLTYKGELDSIYAERHEANAYVNEANAHIADGRSDQKLHVIPQTIRYDPDKDTRRELRSRVAGGNNRTAAAPSDGEKSMEAVANQNRCKYSSCVWACGGWCDALIVEKGDRGR